MSEAEQRALRNAAASSAMEGLPLDAKDFKVVTDILDGKMTLQDFLQSVKVQYKEA